MTYDLKIVNAHIIDGSGSSGKKGAVGIKDGKIVALYDAPEDGEQVIDATDRVACPGFVDVHTHYDMQIVWDKFLSVSPWHGVTTVVMGNCGFGVAPTRPTYRMNVMRTLEKVEGMSITAMKEGLGDDWPFETFPEFMDCIENGGCAINTAVFVGHTPIRYFVMGEDSLHREATEQEVGEMKNLVSEAMDAGALGFASSQVELHFAYDGHKVPSRVASLDEIDALVGAVGEAGGGMIQFAPGQDMTIPFMGKIWEKHKQPISWSALLADSPEEGAHMEKLESSLALRKTGAKVTPQVSCRAVQFDFHFGEPYPFGAVPFFAEAMAGDTETKKRVYADPEFRRQFKQLSGPGNSIFTDWPKRTVVSLNPSDPSVDGTPLVEAAERADKHVVDYVLDLSLETDLKARIRLPAVNFREEEVFKLIDRADDETVIALSDAGAHADQLCDACFSTHLLGHWVRERKALSLEKAIKILTRHPADVFGLKDRGRIDVGCPADVVVFDPDTVGAGDLRRVYDQPGGQDRLIAEADGIDYVIVNGTVLRKHNENQLSGEDQLPGKLLRGGFAQS